MEQRWSKLVAGCKLVAQGRPTGQSCANRCDRGVAWPALDVFSGRSSVQGGSHSFSSCSCPERGGRSRRPVCVCVCVCVTSKTSLPQSINIYTDTCHKSARLANK